MNVRSGAANRGVFRKFVNTARYSSFTRSAQIGKTFSIVKSQFRVVSVRMSVKLRPTFPSVNGAGFVNCAVLNHLFSRDCGDPSSLALTPVLFGRCDPAPNEWYGVPPTICIGFPEANTTMLDICHPPSTAFVTPP